MVISLISGRTFGTRRSMNGQNGASSENSWCLSSHRCSSAVAVMVLETLASPIDVSSDHGTPGRVRSHGGQR